MELQVQGGEKVAVAEAAFGRDFNETLVHQAVVAYMAAGRAGTKAQKTRSEVRGGGIKPWRQKGTGRARAGTTRSPIWRTGGVTFAAKPRDYSQKINKKMYQGAIRSIFSELVRQERLVVVADLTVDSPKTQAFLAQITPLAGSDVLIVSHDVTENLYLASRNLSKVELSDVAGLNPVSLISHEKVLITVDALRAVEEWLA
jgi:large subunit ribosomal protein L4